jgi:hypothetical protein
VQMAEGVLSTRSFNFLILSDLISPSIFDLL